MKIRIVVKPVLPCSEWLQISQYIRHAASARGESITHAQRRRHYMTAWGI